MAKIRSRTNEKRFKCGTCGKKFGSQSNLAAHAKDHRHKARRCPTCGKEFRSAGVFKAHQRGIHGAEFPCTVCALVFSSAKKLNTHSKALHGHFECDICNKVLATRASLRQHKALHQEKKLPCPVCGKRFHVLQGLKIHMRSHSDEKTLSCPECALRFKTPCGLKAHRMSHTGEKPFVCDKDNDGCGKRFVSTTALKSHQRVHTGEKPYVCTYCERSFTNNGNLSSHVKRAHIKEKPYICPAPGCGKSFVAPTELRIHSVVHSTAKPFRCDHEACGRSFANISRLTYHKTLHSETSRKFPCAVTGCGKVFKTGADLMVHIRSHTREKPYPCPMCAKSFVSSTARSDHIRRGHTGEKQHGCSQEECKMRFVTLFELRAHQRTHEKAKTKKK